MGVRLRSGSSRQLPLIRSVSRLQEEGFVFGALLVSNDRERMVASHKGDIMAEAMTVDDVYIRLREFIERLPSGLPRTESGAELKLLHKLFSPEEAEMAMQLAALSGTGAGHRQSAVGMDEKEAAEMLESMARKGLVLRVRGGKERFYLALHFAVGIYEFHVRSIDEEMAGMMDEMFKAEEETPVFRDTVMEQFRVVPVNSAIDADAYRGRL